MFTTYISTEDIPSIENLLKGKNKEIWDSGLSEHLEVEFDATLVSGEVKLCDFCLFTDSYSINPKDLSVADYEVVKSKVERYIDNKLSDIISTLESYEQINLGDYRYESERDK